MPPNQDATILPHRLRPLFPIRTSLIRPNNLLNNRTSLFLSNPSGTLIFRPTTRNRTPRTMKTERIRHLSLYRRLLYNNVVTLPIKIRHTTRLPMHPTTNERELFRQRNFYPHHTTLLPRLLRANRHLGNHTRLYRQRATTNYGNTNRRLPMYNQSDTTTRRRRTQSPNREDLRHQTINASRRPRNYHFVNHGTFYVLVGVYSYAGRLLNLLYNLHHHHVVLARSGVPSNDVQRPLHRRLFRQQGLLCNRTRDLVFLNIKIETTQRVRIFRLDARTNRPVFRQPRRNHVKNQRKRRTLNRHPTRHRQLRSNINRRLLNNTTTITQNIQLPRDRRLYPQTRTRRKLSAINPILYTRLPPTIRCRRTKPRLDRHRPTRHVLRNRLLTTRRPRPTTRHPTRPLYRNTTRLRANDTKRRPRRTRLKINVRRVPRSTTLTHAHQTRRHDAIFLLRSDLHYATNYFV